MGVKMGSIQVVALDIGDRRCGGHELVEVCSAGGPPRHQAGVA